MEDALQKAFLLDLFKGATSQIPGIAFTGLPVNKADISLTEPSQNVRAKWMASCVITGHLVPVLHRTAEFWLGDYDLLIGEVRYEILQQHSDYSETAMGKAQATTST